MQVAGPIGPGVEPAGLSAVGSTAATLSPRGRRRVIAAGLGVIIVGGMGLAIIDAVSPSTPSEVEATNGELAVGGKLGGDDPGSTAPLAAAPADSAAPEPVDQVSPPIAEQAAVALLRDLLEAASPGVRSLAAVALARRRDPKALELLGESMRTASSIVARFEAAYALARAGEESGIEVLREGLGSSSRDERMEAARRLVWLGDDSGKKRLRSMLSLRTHRLGAARLLAILGDEEGLETLRKTAKWPSGPEQRMRALVALGLAGDESVRDDLVGILEDGRFNVGAAEALAVLGEMRAKPALIEQLQRPSVRVRAAIGLRRLGVAPPLTPLANALATGHDFGRVTAAEAILVLTGPQAPTELR